MTFIRRKALKISSWVTWLASPGGKEWAEGLEREVAFIESDWRALAWAIGSTRVLLEPRVAPLASLEEVPGVAHRFVDSLRNGSRFWMVIIQGLIYLPKYFHVKCGPQQFGCALAVLGAAVSAVSILMERWRLKEPWRDEVYDDIGACAQFYRAELERQQRVLWIVPFVFLCYFVGVLLYAASVFSEPLLVAMNVLASTFVLMAYLRMRRINEQRIERLDTLLAKRQ
jgi:hypothetical protein